MIAKRLVPPLPEPDRRQSLDQFLRVLDQHPNLAHFRTIVTTGPERQLALFAALERSLLVGSPAVSPPSPSDEADLLLCDILDCIDRHPVLSRIGCAYGPLRHLANLQAFGVWNGKGPLTQPSARELFATTVSQLTPDPVNTLPSSGPNSSPAPQDSAPGGEQFDAKTTATAHESKSSLSSQTVDSVVVVSIAPHEDVTVQAPDSGGISRQATHTPGEQIPPSKSPPLPLSDGPGSGVGCASSTFGEQTSPQSTPDPLACFSLHAGSAERPIPHRPLRRGRPCKLDDLAKGRLLGLMSFGLSFRQAAAQLGVHHQTLLNAMKRDEQFAQQVSEARLDAISQPLLTVVQASRTSWRAAAWLAKFLEDRRVRSYESTPEEHELARLRQL
jgi:hypothetical protein